MTEKPAPARIPLGIGREAVLDRVIVDKNARIGDGVRLVNSARRRSCGTANYYIRGGIIIVPKERRFSGSICTASSELSALS